MHTEFLASFPVLRTSDLDEARFCVTQRFCDHRLHMPARGPLMVRHNHVAGRHMSINYLHYGADVTIDPGQLGGFYLLQMPISGQARVRHRGSDIAADADTATLLNPDRDTRMSWQGDCRKLLLQIDKGFVETTAAELIGHGAPGPIRFEPQIDLTRPGGAGLKRLILRATQLAGAGALFTTVQGARDLWAERDLATALILHQPSNITHMLNRIDRGAVPAALRRAVDYIHANLCNPIRLNDIATAAAINARSLQKGFQHHYGKSPMDMVRDARLDAARYQLAQRTAPPSVTDVAFSSGFSHLGRFSQAYKARFGHLPSQRH
ncbi:AraC family transcriptional regulator [Oceaniglobus ichthyenteri]|uniref:AraC family transcriptional regulator n=1 Tax=Oceaniglobus ichthyenteri TaxID=2136177 RepID=UPI000D3B0477|nr:AraC family transcriptional regulator [Oceaniglobus ichthyenteri]